MTKAFSIKLCLEGLRIRSGSARGRRRRSRSNATHGCGCHPLAHPPPCKWLHLCRRCTKILVTRRGEGQFAFLRPPRGQREVLDQKAMAGMMEPARQLGIHPKTLERAREKRSRMIKPSLSRRTARMVQRLYSGVNTRQIVIRNN